MSPIEATCEARVADLGREREAVAVRLTALSHYLPRYNRSLARYAEGLLSEAASFWVFTIELIDYPSFAMDQPSIPHLVTRVLWLVFLVGLGVVFAISGVQSGIANRVVLALGLVLLGICAFFQPLLFRAPLRQLIAASQAAAIGPQALRTGLSVSAIGLIWLSLGMRIAGY